MIATHRKAYVPPHLLRIDTVIHGDCLEVLRALPDNSVHAIVTDPPSGISFMGAKWDTFGEIPPSQSQSPFMQDMQERRDNHEGWSPSYFTGRGQTITQSAKAREAFVTFITEVFTEALRVLKPGGHALVWALPRTSHWTAYALENAGFEIRDSIQHIFGSGFPKSHNISVAIDKHLKAEREVVGTRTNGNHGGGAHTYDDDSFTWPKEFPVTAPATPEAQQWQGWGTALKPAHETWWLCRKPLSEKSIAAQVLATGTGAINVDATRIGNDTIVSHGQASLSMQKKSVEYGIRKYEKGLPGADYPASIHQGRWPANTLFSHSELCAKNACSDDCPVAELDRQSKGTRADKASASGKGGWRNQYVGGNTAAYLQSTSYSDTGGASRYFQQFSPDPDDIPPFAYVSKASRSERNSGCEGLPEGKKTGVYDERPSGNFHERLDGKKGNNGMSATNTHPT